MRNASSTEKHICHMSNQAVTCQTRRSHVKPGGHMSNPWQVTCHGAVTSQIHGRSHVKTRRSHVKPGGHPSCTQHAPNYAPIMHPIMHPSCTHHAPILTFFHSSNISIERYSNILFTSIITSFIIIEVWLIN